jgi:hypothetical protein
MLAAAMLPVALWMIAVLVFKVRSLGGQLRHMKHAHDYSQENRWATVDRLQDLMDEIRAGRVEHTK